MLLGVGLFIFELFQNRLCIVLFQFSFLLGSFLADSRGGQETWFYFFLCLTALMSMQMGFVFVYLSSCRSILLCFALLSFLFFYHSENVLLSCTGLLSSSPDLQLSGLFCVG